MFSELIKYFEDGIEDDPFKLSQIVQVVNNNNQIRQIDLQIARLNPMNSAEAIKSLNDIKVKLVSNNDKIAKEMRFLSRTVPTRMLDVIRLHSCMKDMREKDIAGVRSKLLRPSYRFSGKLNGRQI